MKASAIALQLSDMIGPDSDNGVDLFLLALFSAFLLSIKMVV
jgi:hypothetical protein